MLGKTFLNKHSKVLEALVDINFLLKAVSTVFISFLVSIFLFRRAPDFSKSEAFKTIPFVWFPSFSNKNINSNNEYLQKLINSTRFSYTSFVEHCLGHDELRPVSGKCLDTFGFNSTILESVETLLLLNQTDLYKHAHDFIRDNFSCSNMGWINRREMFSRAVGSLIGSYLLTGDEMFLGKAEECSQKAIKIDSKFKYPKPFHNYINMTYKERMWVNGTALQDVSAGLPEIVSLYHITGKNIYLNYYKKIAEALPKKKGVYYFSVLTIPRGLNGTTMTKLDGFTVDFYNNLAIANSLHPLRETMFALNKTRDITKITYSGKRKYLYPLINAASYSTNTESSFQFEGVNLLYNEANDLYSDCSKLFDKEGFRFDGSFFHVLMRNGRENEKILKCVDYVLDKTRREKGFSGFRASSSGCTKEDDVQPSVFLGQFVKAAALTLTNEKMAKYSTLNEKGHILQSPTLIRFPTNYSMDVCSDMNIDGYNLFC